MKITYQFYPLVFVFTEISIRTITLCFALNNSVALIFYFNLCLNMQLYSYVTSFH